MSTYSYKEAFDNVTNDIQSLSLKEQIRLLDDVKASIQNKENDEHLHDVMEFRGGAKEFWKGVDVQKYIDEERNSWDG